MTDLTKITTPFGLLDEATQAALMEHVDPIEMWNGDKWEEVDPSWSGKITYRAKATPPEYWAFGHVLKDSLAEAEAFRAECDRVSPDMGFMDLPIIHVREVL